MIKVNGFLTRRKWLKIWLIHSGIMLPGLNLSFALNPKISIMEELNFNKVRSKDGTEIAYWQSGSGPPLVLVHGTTADHTRWAPVLPQLEEKFTVYAMDRRGRGESGDSKIYDLQREFEDVAAVVDSIPEPVNLFGHSYGAICCLESALLTNNIHKLILYEPPIPTDIAIYPPAVLERIQKHIDQNYFEAALLIFFREVVLVPEPELEYLRSLPVWKVRVNAAFTIPREMKGAEDYKFEAERFKRLKYDTGLLIGGDSPPLFKKATETVQGAIPNSRIYTMPGQQHTAMNTAPELFVSIVLDFLSED